MASLLYTAQQLSTLPFLEDVTLLKKQADSFKPLPKETEERVLQKFRLDWNYHSNAIEGNKLTYGETVAFIMEGVTAKGKTLKDHLDIKGHDEAVKYLIHIVKEKDYRLTEVDIRNLHQTNLKEPYFSNAVTPTGLPTRKEIKIGQYKSSSNHVITPTGETHYYATPEDTPIKMGELMEFYKIAKDDASIHPLVLATLFHHEFTSIHPFDDGNGRMARLLMNLLLMQEGYPPIVVKQDDRTNYYQVLRQADASEFIPIVEYMSGLLTHSLSIYIAGAKGESIEEEDDIDKEIALFKKSMQTNNKDFNKIINQVVIKEINPFLIKINKRLLSLSDLFVNFSEKIELENTVDNVLAPIYSFNDFQKYIDFTLSAFLQKEKDQSILTYSANLINLKKVSPQMDIRIYLIIILDEKGIKIRETSSDTFIFLEYESISNAIILFGQGLFHFIMNELKAKTNE